jgi:hypothetical protein
MMATLAGARRVNAPAVAALLACDERRDPQELARRDPTRGSIEHPHQDTYG